MRTPAQREFASAVKLEVDGDFAKALPILSAAVAEAGPLGLYADYYKGLAELRLGRADEARRTFQAMQSREPSGISSKPPPCARPRPARRSATTPRRCGFTSVSPKTKTTAPDEVLMRLGRAAK